MANKNLEIPEIACREYANKFWYEITAALWSNSGAFEYLPIVFTYNELHDENGNIVFGVNYTHINTSTKISIVYPVVCISASRTEVDIQSTIRHEVIHYLLATQYKCHNDCSALFWLICDCFNGGAYLPMNGKSQQIYGLSLPYFKAILEMCRQTKNVNVAINFSLMLTAIDNAEFDETPDFEKMEKYLKVCLEAAKIADS